MDVFCLFKWTIYWWLARQRPIIYFTLKQYSPVYSQINCICLQKMFVYDVGNRIIRSLVRRKGIIVNSKKAKGCQNMAKLTSLTELRSFIGLLHFFRWFINNLIRIFGASYIFDKKDIVSKMGVLCDLIFEKLKYIMISLSVLVSLDWKKPFRCKVDALLRL